MSRYITVLFVIAIMFSPFATNTASANGGHLNWIGVFDLNGDEEFTPGVDQVINFGVYAVCSNAEADCLIVSVVGNGEVDLYNLAYGKYKIYLLGNCYFFDLRFNEDFPEYNWFFFKPNENCYEFFLPMINDR